VTVDLSTRYLGLQLRSPVIASASPLTRDPEVTIKLEAAGAGAIVMPSLFEEEIENEEIELAASLEAGTEGFAEAQRRLLGPGVFCAAGPPGAPATLQASADLAAELLERLADPRAGEAWRHQLAREGEQRLGRPGGTARMAAAIMELLPPER